MPYAGKLWSNRNVVSNVNTKFVSSPARCNRRCSPSSPVLCTSLLDIPTLSPNLTPSSSYSMPSMNPFFGEFCWETLHLTPECSLFSKDDKNQLVAIRSWNMQKSSGEQQLDRWNRSHHYKNKHPRNRGRWNFSSPDRNRHVMRTLKIPALMQNN